MLLHSTCLTANLYSPLFLSFDSRLVALDTKFFKVYGNSFSCSSIRHFHLLVFLCFLPIAKSYQNNQSKKFGLLSQLALSSQTKFFLKSPPKFRKKAEADPIAGSPDADLAAEPDGEADTCESQSPTGRYESCLSAGLDSALSDLLSLDSHTEVEEGISLRGAGRITAGLQLRCCFPLVASLSCALFLIHF